MKYSLWLQTALVFLLIHAAAYFTSLQSAFSKVATVQAENISAKQTLAQLKQEYQIEQSQRMQQQEKPKSSLVRPIQIALLFELIQQSGLILVTMTEQGRTESPLTAIDHVRVVIEGSFPQFADLMTRLPTQLQVGLVTNVVGKAVNNEKCIFTVDFVLWQGLLPDHLINNSPILPQIEHDPMCASADELITESVETVFARTPQTQLKIIGSYQRGKEKWLMLMLPDGRLIDLPASMMKTQGKHV